MSIINNIIGEPLNRNTRSQFEQRRKALSIRGSRDDNNVKYIANSNAWIKLTSLVNVTDSRLLAKFQAKSPTEPAKKWVLFGGVQEYGQDPKNGLDAYRVGLKNPLGELGYRPMPGIVSIDVKTEGRVQAFVVADVKIRANTLEQLDAIDMLYFRLGYAYVLEWGHTTYLDNSGILKTTDFTDSVDAFSSGQTRDSIQRQINSLKRKLDGNYDGIVGLLTNYSWQATPDGGYDCSLKIVGLGAIADSLKINALSFGGSAPISTPMARALAAGEGAETPASALDNVLYNIKAAAYGRFNQRSANAFGAPNVLNFLKNEFFNSDFNGLFFPDRYLESLGAKYFGGTGPASVQQAFNHGFNANWLASGGGSAPAVDFNELCGITVVNTTVYGQELPEGGVVNPAKAYIKLGFLLALINNCCSLYTENSHNSGKKTPAVYIDFNPETNFCYTNKYQISVMPEVCIIPITDEFGNHPEFIAQGSSQAQQATQTAAVGMYSYQAPAKVPVVITEMCEITDSKLTEQLIAGNSGTGLSYINTSNYRYKGNKARLMEIQLCVDYLMDVLASLQGSDPESNVSLNSFLETILRDINKALGSINNLKYLYDKDSNCIRIYDDQQLDQNTSYPVLPVFGLNSIAKSISIFSETSTAIGNMLAITAQGPSSVKDSNSAVNSDTTTLAEINSGLEERTAKIKTTKADSKTAPEGNVVATAFSQFVINYYQAFWIGNTSSPTYASGAVVLPAYQNSAVNFYAGSLNLTKVKKSSNNGGAVMPIKCTVTTQGISTLVPYEAFALPADRLPSQYKNSAGSVKVAFMVTGLDHSVQNNVWTTQIQSQMINIRPGQAAQAPPPPVKNYNVTVEVNKTSTGGNKPIATTGGNLQACPNGYQDVTRTYNTPAKKKLIDTYGWPVELHPETNYKKGPFCARLASTKGFNTYYKNPDYRKQLVKKVHAFTGGKTFTIETLPTMASLLDAAYKAIEGAGLGYGVTRWSAPYYPRDVKKSGSQGSLSGHAFGIAIDVNYDIFPDKTPVKDLEAAAKQTVDLQKQGAAKVILLMKDLQDVNGKKLFAWGGTYINPPDVMHFTPKDVGI